MLAEANTHASKDYFDEGIGERQGTQILRSVRFDARWQLTETLLGKKDHVGYKHSLLNFDIGEKNI